MDKTQSPNLESRRRFLSIIPIGLIGGVATIFGGMVSRFLQPVRASSEAKSDSWKALGPLEDLRGEQPIRQSLRVDVVEGWATSSKEHVMYVLPDDNHRVLSAVCPHEQCPVLWDDSQKNFLCPCHDSRFSKSGVRMTGPANSDLQQLLSKVEDGILSVQI